MIRTYLSGISQAGIHQGKHGESSIYMVRGIIYTDRLIDHLTYFSF